MDLGWTISARSEQNSKLLNGCRFYPRTVVVLAKDPGSQVQGKQEKWQLLP